MPPRTLSIDDFNTYTFKYIGETLRILAELDLKVIERFFVKQLVALKERQGRLFILGIGGSAANASHMVNDCMKIAGIEAYAPTDNVALLTATTNDVIWQDVFTSYLKYVHFNLSDMLFIMSGSGGEVHTGKSLGLVHAFDMASAIGATTLAILGKRDSPLGRRESENYFKLFIPEVNPDNISAHSEEMQGVVWHCIVNNPLLQPTIEQAWLDTARTQNSEISASEVEFFAKLSAQPKREYPKILEV